MTRAFVASDSGYENTPRTWNSRQAAEWKANYANPQSGLTPQQKAVADFYAAAHEQQKLREQKWAADEERRRNEIKEREKAIVKHNERVASERVTALMLTAMFERHAATDAEKKKVELLVARNHPAQSANVELYEYLLLQLRALLGEI